MEGGLTITSGGKFAGGFRLYWAWHGLRNTRTSVPIAGSAGGTALVATSDGRRIAASERLAVVGSPVGFPPCRSLPSGGPVQTVRCATSNDTHASRAATSSKEIVRCAGDRHVCRRRQAAVMAWAVTTVGPPACRQRESRRLSFSPRLCTPVVYVCVCVCAGVHCTLDESALLEDCERANAQLSRLNLARAFSVWGGKMVSSSHGA